MPRQLRHQQWSAFNVPLMWAAASGDADCHLLQWLEARAERLPPMRVGDEQISGRATVRTGWEVLRNTLQSWGITSREHLAEWIHNQGFRRPWWRAHFSGRAQERILNGAVAMDAGGVGLEVAYVNIVLDACRQEPQAERLSPAENFPAGSRPPVAAMLWEFLDEVNLQEICLRKFKVLQSCPVQFKGRYPGMSCGIGGIARCSHGA